MDYNSFYHASLDFVVENILPYQQATKKAYNRLKEKRHPNELSNKNYEILSSFYSIIMTKGHNFGINKTAHGVHKKINNINTPPPKNRSRKMNTTLTAEMKQWLKHGIDKRYNIIYDTTMDGTPKRINQTVLPLLEEEHKENPDKKKYKIVVILVDAPADTIKNRLRSRHQKMANRGTVRAISAGLTDKWIKDNVLGFIASETLYSPDPPIAEVREKHANLLAKNANNEKTNEKTNALSSAYQRADFKFYYEPNL
jgi:hypothetical protein